MILLLDFDSILYHSVYRIVSIDQMRQAIADYGKQKAKQWLLETIYDEGVERCEKEIEVIRNYLERIYFEPIASVELYITTCKNSFRKALAPSYKSNRKPNKYVWVLREHYSINGAFESDTHEADDLIADRARELGMGNYIIASMDKDLKQIGGHYWSYYKQVVKDESGEPILSEFGWPEREYKQQEIQYITEDESETMFWTQMLMGDASDGVAGLPRVGIKTAEKILASAKVNWITVAREYIKRGFKNEFMTNYKLLKL